MNGRRNGSRSSNAKFFRANFGNPQDLDMYYSLPTHDWQDEVMERILSIILLM